MATQKVYNQLGTATIAIDSQWLVHCGAEEAERNILYVSVQRWQHEEAH